MFVPGEDGDETTRGVQAGERWGGKRKGGHGRLSGGWRIVGWGRGCGTRESGLGEILRGLRAMARVKRARICACMCACVRRTRVRMPRVHIRIACTRVSHCEPMWSRVCTRTCVRESLARASECMRAALARVHAREKSILAVRRVQIVDTSYKPVTPKVRALVNYYYREFRRVL